MRALDTLVCRLLSVLALSCCTTALWAVGLQDTVPYREFPDRQVDVGRLLFFDKILSGNRNISCATCHHPQLGTSDGLSLGIGEGGEGLGPHRTAGTGLNRIERRVPRNAPALWNLGAYEIETLMHDGRISVGDIYGNGFNTPAQEWLPQGLVSVLAAQALFPMTSETEMAGSNEENEIGGARNDRVDYAWPLIAKRIRSIPEYARLLVNAYDDIDQPEQITIVHIANALAAFISVEFKSLDSAYDEWFAGDKTALSSQQLRGMQLFFGDAGCSACHSGNLFSSHNFRALSVPQFGPGRTRQWDPISRDLGRMGESNRLEDAYRFRVPMLRNVALTAPYGHNGAYPTLEAMVRHHLNPIDSRKQWEPAQASLPEAPWLEATDFIVLQDALEQRRQERYIDVSLPSLDDDEIQSLVAFLESLTGQQAARQEFLLPETVPSGLPVDVLATTAKKR